MQHCVTACMFTFIREKSFSNTSRLLPVSLFLATVTSVRAFCRSSFLELASDSMSSSFFSCMSVDAWYYMIIKLSISFDEKYIEFPYAALQGCLSCSENTELMKGWGLRSHREPCWTQSPLWTHAYSMPVIKNKSNFNNVLQRETGDWVQINKKKDYIWEYAKRRRSKYESHRIQRTCVRL